jgi:hypothetical protein
MRGGVCDLFFPLSRSLSLLRCFRPNILGSCCRVGGALHYAKQEHGTYIRMGGGKLQQVISITAGDRCKQDQDHLYPPAAENVVCVHLANQCTLRSAVHTKSSRKQNTTQRSGDVSVVISSSYLNHHHITPVSTHAVCQSSHRPSAQLITAYNSTSACWSIDNPIFCLPHLDKNALNEFGES